MIYRYNREKETHEGPNNYFIHRGASILGNPYTDIKDKKTLAQYIVPSKEEAIRKYSQYFDIMYGGNLEFKQTIDEIYEKYKKGEDIYLGCYCDSDQPCHGEVIKKKIEARLMKERIMSLKLKRNESSI